MFSNIFLETGFDFGNVVDLATLAFSVLLCILAITAYRNTKVKKIAFAAIAFALFSVQLFIEYLDEAIHLLEDQVDTVLSLITLGILLLFFFAIIKKQ